MGNLFGSPQPEPNPGGSGTVSGGTGDTPSTTTTTTSVLTQGGQIGGVTADQAGGRKLSSGGFPDDGAKRMPSASDRVAAEAARMARVAKQKSGRVSTNLSGTRSYINTFLGGTQ